MKIRIYDVKHDHATEHDLTPSQFAELKAFLKELKDPPNINYRAVLDSYNMICSAMPPATKLTNKRRRAIARALKDGYDMDDVFRTAAASPFLCGKNDHQWKASFDWIMQPDNLIKVAEGNFTPSQTAPSAPAMHGNPFAEYGR